jgi:hypothetical protein
MQQLEQLFVALLRNRLTFGRFVHFHILLNFESRVVGCRNNTLLSERDGLLSVH